MRKAKAIRELAAQLDEIHRLVDRIELATLVRDPGSTLSADAYDGLRKQVVAASGERLAHLNQLAQMHAALSSAPGDGNADLLRVVEEWMGQSGVGVFTDTSQQDAFEILGGRGDRLEVITPAYIDNQTHRLLKQGRARRVDVEPAPIVPEEDVVNERPQPAPEPSAGGDNSGQEPGVTDVAADIEAPETPPADAQEAQ